MMQIADAAGIVQANVYHFKCGIAVIERRQVRKLIKDGDESNMIEMQIQLKLQRPGHDGLVRIQSSNSYSSLSGR